MAKKSNFQIHAEYSAVRIVLWILGVLPRYFAVKISIAASRIGYHVLSSLRRTGMRNLEIAFPEISVRERETVLRGTFDNLGRVLGEVSQFPKTTPAQLKEIIDFELDDVSRDLYAQNKADRRGVLITTGHLGNWELLVFGFAALHEPISYLARPLDNPLIEELTVRLRTRFGNRPINKTHSAMRAIKILREGGILGILSDVNAHPKEGVFVPFFGVDACTPSGAAMLAMRSNSLIFPTFCIWDKDTKRYKFVHGRLLEPVNTGDRKRDVIATTALYTAEIESMIRKYPEQWMWIHKRWKTRPPGAKPIY